VYALITKPDIGEIQRLIFNAELPPILTPPGTMEEPEQSPALPLALVTCRSREAMIDVAEAYLNNEIYLNSYHINDNPACSGRVKPRYLGSAGTYPSVPYAWNMWDTVDQFNNFMSGGINGYFAGDIDETYESCSRGIDCSGLVSRAWDLGSHYGTCSLENISFELPNVYMLQPGDIMNRCSQHTIIFHSLVGDGMLGYEATIFSNYDRVVLTYRPFITINTLVPRRYTNVCSKIHLPIIMKTNVEMNSALPSSNPYPPPEPSQALGAYPPPDPYP
jgi:hypothetical protein